MKEPLNYQPAVKAEDDVEGQASLLQNAAHEDEERQEETIRPLSQRQALQHQASNLRSILAGVIIGIVLSFFAFGTFRLLEPNDKCTRRASVWSPALQMFHDNDFKITRFNGALREPNSFRGPPSPEIDQAWNEITYPEGGLVRLSEEQLQKVNASEYAAAYTEEMGGGYMAGIEVFHQLHCVNMLRQATYMDYYLPQNPEWKDEKTLRYHLDHCVDMLRQKLMCDPDVGMVTYVWAKGWKQAFPDFNTAHKCRDYSKVLDWAHENWVHGRNIADIERAPGALERDTRP